MRPGVREHTKWVVTAAHLLSIFTSGKKKPPTKEAKGNDVVFSFVPRTLLKRNPTIPGSLAEKKDPLVDSHSVSGF
jgi:hypothetical protein